MGTSLSGLTPQTTFDGLLKVGDNDPLTADLKAISDGSGNDSAIQLSTGELKVMGQFNVDTDTATTEINLRGNSLTINQVYQANETTYNSIQMINSSGIRLKNGAVTTLAAKGNKVGIGTADPTSTLQVVGSGADNTTTSLLVQNSAGTNIFKVVDDNTMFYHTHKFRSAGGYLYIEGEGNTNRSLKVGTNFTASSFNGHIFKTYDGTAYSEAMRITGANDQFVGIGETIPTARLHVKGDGTNAALIVRNGAGLDLLNIADSGTVFLGVGNNSSSQFHLRAGGQTLINGSSSGTTIKGTGATPTTAALLVQNSAGTNLFKVNDSGNGFYINDDEASKLRFYASGNSGLILGERNLRIESGGGNAININGSGTNGVIIGSTATNLATNVSLAVRGKGADNTTTALLVENSAGTELLKVTDDGVINARQSLFVNHATNSARALRLGWGSLYATDNAAELSIGAVYSQNTAPRIILGGKTRSGGADAVLVQALNGMYIATTASTENPSAQLHVKGSGNDATTTALLVQNSDGTDVLRVMDGGADKVLRTSSAQIGSLEFVGANIGRGGGNPITFAGTNQIGMGVSTPDASAKLQVDSTSQGFLPPRMTSEQKNAITSPAAGLMVYDTDQNQMNYWNGSAWIAF